jgi:hypothetical protein
VSERAARFHERRAALAKNLDQTALKAVQDVLGVAKGERVLIVTHPDPEVSRVAWAVHDAVVQVGGEPVFLATQPRSGAELADPVLIKALESEPAVLVLLTNGRIGGDPERLARPIHGTYTHYLQYLLSDSPTRGFWANGLTRATFTKGLSVGRQDLEAQAQRIVQRLQEAAELRVTTGKGYEFMVGVHGDQTRSEAGDFRSPGAVGELPSGEVVVPVVPGTSQGKIRLLGALGLPEEVVPVRAPLDLAVEDGRVVSTTGGQEARMLENAMADAKRSADQAVREGWLTRTEAEAFGESTHQVKELAFGVNPGLKPRGEIRGDTKALGVLRVVLGAGLREYPPGAPVSLELAIHGASVSVVKEDGTEEPLLEGGRWVEASRGRRALTP